LTRAIASSAACLGLMPLVKVTAIYANALGVQGQGIAARMWA
jgi:hypothetical protein